MPKLVFIVLLVMVIAGLAGWRFFSTRPTNRELIEQLVAKAEHGVETKSSAEIMSCVSQNYRDEAGLTYNDILRLALAWRRNPQQAEVVIGNYTIEVSSPTATGQFEVQVILRGGEGVQFVNMNLTVQFEKQRQGPRKLWRSIWLVSSVNGHRLMEMIEE